MFKNSPKFDIQCRHIQLELGVVSKVSHKRKSFSFLITRKSKNCAVFRENLELDALIIVGFPYFFNNGKSALRLIGLDRTFADILIYDKDL